MVKRLPTMQETQVRPLGWEDSLEKEMATHSRTLAWKIPWTEEPGRLQSMGSLRVGHDCATSLSFTFIMVSRSSLQHLTSFKEDMEKPVPCPPEDGALRKAKLRTMSTWMITPHGPGAAVRESQSTGGVRGRHHPEQGVRPLERLSPSAVPGVGPECLWVEGRAWHEQKEQ